MASIPYQVAQCSRSVGSHLRRWFVVQVLFQDTHGFFEVLVEIRAVKSQVSNGHNGECAHGGVRVGAAADKRWDELMLFDVRVKEPGITTQVAEEVAGLGPHRLVFVREQVPERGVELRFVEGFLDVVRPGQPLRQGRVTGNPCEV
mmetsp:Transcript_941/g.1505  ORF Transcript_941/g.1505 Transcript_941/m.1505 type:complete len:146 (-) Transcript_941:491-928(-)